MSDELTDQDLTDEDLEAVPEPDTPEAEATVSVASDVSGPEGFDADVDAVLDEESGPARGPDGKFVAKAAEAAAVAPVAEAPAPPDPFASYAPFQFRVDGTDVALEGLRADEQHILIPRELWQRELLPNFVGSRQAWQQERGQWTQRERQYQQQVAEAAERTRAITDEFQALIADPNKLVAFIENYEREAPLLREKMRADAAERQLQQRAQHEQAIQQQTQYEALEYAGADALETEVTELLKDPAFASLAANDDERDDLLVELWQTKAKHWIHVTPDNRVGGIDRDSLRSELARRAQFIARREAKWRNTTTTEQRNAAAVAPPATSPQTAPIPGKANARPKQAAKAPAPRREPVVQRRFTEDDMDHIRKDLASVFDD